MSLQDCRAPPDTKTDVRYSTTGFVCSCPGDASVVTSLLQAGRYRTEYGINGQEIKHVGKWVLVLRSWCLSRKFVDVEQNTVLQDGSYRGTAIAAAIVETGQVGSSLHLSFFPCLTRKHTEN